MTTGVEATPLVERCLSVFKEVKAAVVGIPTNRRIPALLKRQLKEQAEKIEGHFQFLDVLYADFVKAGEEKYDACEKARENGKRVELLLEEMEKENGRIAEASKEVERLRKRYEGKLAAIADEKSKSKGKERERERSRSRSRNRARVTPTTTITTRTVDTERRRMSQSQQPQTSNRKSRKRSHEATQQPDDIHRDRTSGAGASASGSGSGVTTRSKRSKRRR